MIVAIGMATLGVVLAAGTEAHAADPLLVDEAVEPAFASVAVDALVEAGVVPDQTAVQRLNASREVVPDSSAYDVLPSVAELEGARTAFYDQRYGEVVHQVGPWLDAIEAHPRAFIDQPEHLMRVFDVLAMYVRTLDAMGSDEASIAMTRLRGAFWGVSPVDLDVPPSFVQRWERLRGPASCVVRFVDLGAVDEVRVDGRIVRGHDGRDHTASTDSTVSFAMPCRRVAVDVVVGDAVWRQSIDPNRAREFDVGAWALLVHPGMAEALSTGSPPEVLAAVARLVDAEAVWFLDRGVNGEHRLGRVDAMGNVATAMIQTPRARTAESAVESLRRAHGLVEESADSSARRSSLALGLVTTVSGAAALGLEVSVASARDGLSDCSRRPGCVVSGDIAEWRETARTRRMVANSAWIGTGVGLLGTVVIIVTRGRDPGDDGPTQGPSIQATGSGLRIRW